MSNRRLGHAQELMRLPRAEWPAYLTAHSGLPGPRADLALVAAVADTGDLDTFLSLAATGQEYLVLCSVVGLGQVLARTGEHALEARLRAAASDGRWRVREGVAIALQRLGDADPARLAALAGEWADDPDPLVQRAAVAGVCEPRLLTGEPLRDVALDLCIRVTTSLAARPAHERRTTGVRTLRQALGYCWSVAVAADPARGVPAFLALADLADVDVAWLVRENRRKARLSRLLPPGSA